MNGILSPEIQGLLAAAGAGLQASGPSRMPVSLGQILGGGLSAGMGAYGGALKDQRASAQSDMLMEIERQKLAMTKEQYDRALKAAQRQDDFMKMLRDRMQQSPSAAALGQGAAVGDIGPTNTNAARMAQMPQAGGQNVFGVPAPAALADMALNDGKNLPKMMMEGSKGIVRRAGSDVVNPITGESIAPPLPVMPPGVSYNPGTNRASLVPGLGEAKAGMSAIPDYAKPPTTIKLSNQRELQLTQPELVQYSQFGVLPTRYQALANELPGVQFRDPGQPAATPAVAPQQDVVVPPAVQANRDQTRLAILREELKANPNDPSLKAELATLTKKLGIKSSGHAVVGATQSESEQRTQAGQTAARKKIDEEFGKDFVTWTTGGAGADAAKQISQLQDVSAALKSGETLTGPWIGRVPDAAKSFTGVGQRAIAMRERVEEVVQRSLRAILGAQFTEKEGERLIARAYNPNQQESENLVRVNRLLEQLRQAFDAKQDAITYFEENGTLEGWGGKLFSPNDFDPFPNRAKGKIGGKQPMVPMIMDFNDLPGKR